jgi:hypothetical protein
VKLARPARPKEMTRELWALPLVTCILGGMYVGWQIFGLRYTNHDDIFLSLQAAMSSGDWMNAAARTAARTGRFQAFLTVPIILGAGSLVRSPLYDLLNISSLFAVYAGLVWLLSAIGSLRDSLATVSVALFLFPLHYYYTFPQGYPLVFCVGLILLFVSLILLQCYLKHSGRLLLFVSVILFSLSLLGEEYNFILHASLLGILLLVWIPKSHKLLRIALPYVAAWVLVAALELSYSISHRGTGITDVRTTLGFDLVAYAKTFLTLEQKALLATGLAGGINLHAAVTQGVPDVPTVLSFKSLAHRLTDWGSLIVVFLVASTMSWLALFSQRISRGTFIRFSLVCIAVAVLPVAVLSLSQLYQHIVPAGFIQGHPATFYTQLGASGFLFLLCAAGCNRFSRSTRHLVVSVCGALLGAYSALTFLYNDINRQVMSANQQKWAAFEQLAIFARADRPDLGARALFAPDFWTSSGVSDIPKRSFRGKNYWTAYAATVLKSPLQILGPETRPPIDAVYVRYFSTPAGDPLLVIYEPATSPWLGIVTLVAPRPLTGELSYRVAEATSATRSLVGWKCQSYCTMRWEEDRALRPETIRVKPADVGPTSLLAQFFLPREGAYANPLSGSHTD